MITTATSRSVHHADPGEGSKGPSKRLVEYLCDFVGDTYHPSHELDADRWPELEDLFTCVDLSANSGHHLGANHSPSALRTVRRALISRIIRMLRKAYDDTKDDPDENWRTLDKLLASINPATNAFVSLNWDTVAEERMLELHPNLTLKYGTSFVPARLAVLQLFRMVGTSRLRGAGPPASLRTACPSAGVSWPRATPLTLASEAAATSPIVFRGCNLNSKVR